jgi:hypothetical protein
MPLGVPIEQLLALSVGAAATILAEYFWRRRQQARRKRAVIEELDRLAAHFLREAGAAQAQRRECRPGGEFFQALTAVESQLRALFSPAAWRAYRALQSMIPAPVRGSLTIPDFAHARTELLALLRQET